MTADAKRSCATHDELLPCPHCGQQPSFGVIEEDGANFGAEFIDCSNCGASTNLVFPCKGDVKRELRERWNKRTPVSETVPNPPPGMLWVDEQSFRIIVSTLTKEQMREVCLKEGERLFKNAKIGAFINADGSVTPERDASAPSATPRSTELKFCPMCEKEWESDVR